MESHLPLCSSRLQERHFQPFLNIIRLFVNVDPYRIQKSKIFSHAYFTFFFFRCRYLTEYPFFVRSVWWCRRGQDRAHHGADQQRGEGARWILRLRRGRGEDS
jgi:hypothetical protein